MSAPTLDRTNYPAVCQPCPNDPAACMESLRRICECTEALLRAFDTLAEGIVPKDAGQPS